MAVMKEVEATIQCDGQNLPEHPDPALNDTPNNTYTTYVEVTPGTQFCIAISWPSGIANQSELCGVAFKVSIDGVRIMADVAFGFPSKSLVDGVLCREDEVLCTKPLLFGNVATVSGAPTAVSVGEAAKVGTIRIDYYRVRTIEFTETLESGIRLEKRGPIAEKALVKGSNTVDTSFGPSTPHRARRIAHATYFDAEPYATIKFLYRTRESLLLMGIIPDDQPQVNQQEERPVEEMSREELELFVRSQRDAAHDTATRGVKRERTEDPSELADLKRQLREQTSVKTRGQGTRAQPLEIIDLDP